jgi:hypothetical protein
MSKKTSKSISIGGLVLIGLVNILIDLYWKHQSEERILFDTIFYLLIVIAVVSITTKRNDLGPPSQNKQSEPPKPFWNKPSPVFLQSEAQPFSEAQRWVVLFLMLVPFGMLIYLLLN